MHTMNKKNLIYTISIYSVHLQCQCPNAHALVTENSLVCALIKACHAALSRLYTHYSQSVAVFLKLYTIEDSQTLVMLSLAPKRLRKMRQFVPYPYIDNMSYTHLTRGSNVTLNFPQSGPREFAFKMMTQFFAYRWWCLLHDGNIYKWMNTD